MGRRSDVTYINLKKSNQDLWMESVMRRRLTEAGCWLTEPMVPFTLGPRPTFTQATHLLLFSCLLSFTLTRFPDYSSQDIIFIKLFATLKLDQLGNWHGYSHPTMNTVECWLVTM